MNTNVSAHKLINIALSGQHMPFCPHPNKGKGIECVCWLHAATKWKERTQSLRAVRVRKPKQQKTHSDRIVCGAKNVVVRSNDDTKVNCLHCKKLMTNPPKRLSAKNRIPTSHAQMPNAVTSLDSLTN